MDTLALKADIRNHLETKILPFWEKLLDVRGGYYGYVDFDLNIHRDAVKGCILNSRILWFFSNGAMTLKDDRLLAYADHAYEFLTQCCLDGEYGGIYWSVTCDGHAADRMKHTYNQAFAIYALASYYDAAKEPRALALARELYRLIEEKCRDDRGYLEAFDQNFEPMANEKLSENGVLAEKTMNTLLHVFEAYTELYRVTGDPQVAQSLRWIMDIFAQKVYNSQEKRQEVFFDADWNSLIDIHSYGHDIESAWLIDRGCELLGDPRLTSRMGVITRALTQQVYEKAFRGGSLLNECVNGVDDPTRIWWGQAEALVGFINGYQKTPEHGEYMEAVGRLWDYIRTRLVDPREGSEWFWELDAAGCPSVRKPLVEPWKCPYHNGRMCFEVIRRL